MGLLLTKILLLLVLAAGAGAAFAYWWFRRHYQDVSLEHAREQEELRVWRTRFEQRLASAPPLDLTPLSAQLAALDSALRGLRPSETDLAPLAARLDDIERRLEALQAAQQQPLTELEPLSQQLAALHEAVRGMPAPADLSLTDKRLTAIEHALFPVQTRLDELSSAVRALRTAPERPAALQERREAPAASAGESTTGPRNLLKHAEHGKPDDLTQIRGVPKLLEQRLHKVGVFYFWQIADWTPEDVRYVDSQLRAHQGSIERDGWVSQASELAAAPSAAPRPLEH
jgi:predicted flap endonuclease-1-like 5' DNA nuclease